MPAVLYYADYLKLDQLLSLQSPKSTPVAHDELLFIVVHQTFELWFKQILFELDTVLSVMGQAVVAEKELGAMVDRLHRITVIERLLIDEIDVLETMTPLDFLDFRDELIPASGFQSTQFRLIENKFGLDPRHRLKIKGMPYTRVLSSEHAALVQQSETHPSLHDHIEHWLERTPFLSFGTFDFWSAYRDAVNTMLEREREQATRSDQLSAFNQTVEAFDAVFDADQWNQMRKEGKFRLSHRAFLAALLINLFRDEPIFQLPFRLLTALVDVDEGFTTWRQRHALLAHRMIGGRIGTGGTTGHAYLEAAAARHRVFTDLFDLPTFYIPRSALPVLPADVQEQMGFRYR